VFAKQYIVLMFTIVIVAVLVLKSLGRASAARQQQAVPLRYDLAAYRSNRSLYADDYVDDDVVNDDDDTFDRNNNNNNNDDDDAQSDGSTSDTGG
jgi:hypothetical protein